MRSLAIHDRPFDSFSVGEAASFTKTISDADIESFASLSWDRNPLHTDNSYASATRYGRRHSTAHGMLVAAPLSTMAGHFLPGRRCVLVEMRSSFVHPVYPGDTLTYRGEVTQISAAVQVLKVDIEVTNQDGVAVLRGRYKAQVMPATSEAWW